MAAKRRVREGVGLGRNENGSGTILVRFWGCPGKPGFTGFTRAIRPSKEAGRRRRIALRFGIEQAAFAAPPGSRQPGVSTSVEQHANSVPGQQASLARDLPVRPSQPLFVCEYFVETERGRELSAFFQRKQSFECPILGERSPIRTASFRISGGL